MLTVNEAYEAFIADAIAVRHVSTETVKFYKSNLKRFLIDFGDHVLTDLDRACLKAFFARLSTYNVRYEGTRRARTGKLSPHSQHAIFRAVRALLRFCTQEYGLSDGLLKGLKITIRGKRTPKTADPSDVRKALNSLDLSTVQGKRNYAMLLALADTGMRAGGLCSMTLERMVLADFGGQALITEKGGMDRIVFFTEYTARALRAWLDVRPKVAHSYVFVGLGGRKPGTPLTPSGLNRVLDSIKRRAKVEGLLNPHSLRHMFAREQIRNGNDLATVSQLLGHSSVSVTADFYAVFNTNELAQRHKRFTAIRNVLEGDS